MAARKIVQIMPAAGWAARFAERGDEYTSPLVGWALVQDGAGAAVVGLVAGKQVELCDADPAFVGYEYVPELLADGLDEFEAFDDDFDGGDDADDGPLAGRRPNRLN